MRILALPFYGCRFVDMFHSQANKFVSGIHDPYGALALCLNNMGATLSEDITCDLLVDFSQYYVALKTPGTLSSTSKKIYICIEPPVVQVAHHRKSIKQLTGVYDYILSIYGDHVDNKTVFKINTPYCFEFEYTPICKYSDKKLVTNISGNKSSIYPKELYSKRVEVIRYFESHHPEEFDLYGQRWTTEEYPSYKGSVEDKFETYQRYKFAVCFENNVCQDGITEKIFDCFLCRCVPIYLGSVNILDYIPEGCFIDYRQFASNEDMYQFISQMPEQQYNKYIENIESYLQSSQKNVFSPEHFAEQVCKVMSLPQRHKNNIWLKIKAKWFLLCSRINLYDASYIPCFITRVCNKIKKLLKGQAA